MIQVKNIVDALYGLIGWRADFSNEVKIDSGLTESKSGLYYQDAHPLLTLKNMASIAPDFANMDWPVWDKDKAYHTGDLAAIYGEEQKGFDLYRCIADNTGQDPTDDNSQYWAVVSPFSAWLEEKTRASIANAVTHFVFTNMPKGGTKSILEHRLLFNTVGRIGDRIANGGNLVGLEVHPIHAYDVCVDIHKIGLQAINKDNMQATGSVDLIVKSSNDMLGELSREALIAGGYQTKYKELNKQVANTQGGQTLYAMYFQNALEANGLEAVNRTIDWSKAPCPACNIIEHQAFLAWSKYIEVWPFYVASQNIDMLDGNKFTFDQQSMFYVNNTNFGLNLEISVYCDYTDFIIRNKSELIPLLLKQIAVDMLKEAAYNANVRANRNSVNISRIEVMQVLEGSQDTQGLFKELENMYKGLTISMRGLDKVCRPCCNNGLRYTTT